MCGIAGMMCSGSNERNNEILRRMTNIMIHRGPDDTGFWRGPHMALGFCRLSIVDLTAGHQPIANEDGTIWLVFNGEIYNFQSLRTLLHSKGHHFTTSSDSEVIVHLYEEYGIDCVHHLKGMFAFVIWDSKQRMMLGARDHFGIKPFYYMHSRQEKCLAFASEIKALLAAGDQQPSMNIESLYHYLSFQYVPEPQTMFNGINKLPPAHRLIAKPNGSIVIEQYWKPVFSPEQRPLNDRLDQLRTALNNSVGRHLSGDVEAGCFLSSGIDSTAIASLMKQRGSVKTFSVGFEGTHNETEIAERTAMALGTEHHSMVIQESDYFSVIPQAVWHQDEPIADPSSIALFHLAKLAASSVKVVLSGEGADELFGGYRIYREPSALSPLANLPQMLRRLLRYAAEAMPEGMKGRSYMIRGTTPLEQRFLGNANIFANEMKLKLLRNEYWPTNRFSDSQFITEPFYAETRSLDPVTRMQHIDLNLWLPGNILMKADKMSMAHSLELRVPFLDLELFDLAAAIPTSLKLAKGTTKYVLRKALEDVVPSFIADRPKLGFPVPMRQWMAGPRGKEMLEQIVGSGIGEYIHLDYAASMLKRHQEGAGDYSRRLYTLYILAMWHDIFLKSSRR